MKIDKSNKTGELVLSSGHSIIVGHKPVSISNDMLAQHLDSGNNGTIVEQFGLWDVASPNYATYYPDVKAEDLKPKDDEFIEPIFRMLSETIVSKGYRPIDFSKPGVLRASMPMLLGQTINIDHEVAVGNAIGAVKDVYWQKAYKTKSGIEVPAGINGLFKIDGKSNPRIARGIMMDPPSIHSNSVTVRFKWEPSHSIENIDEFWNKLGTLDKDGVMYRLVVTEILGYTETSLVSHGADPWAQKVNSDNEINNPEYAKKISFSADKGVTGFVAIDFKNELKLSADKGTIPTPVNNNNTEHKTEELCMEEMIKQFENEFGFNEGDLNKDNLVSKMKEKLQADANELATLKAEKLNLETEKANLETDKQGLEEKLNNFTEIESEFRDEAEKLYKLSKGEEADPAIINLIKTGDIKSTRALMKNYKKEVEDKFQETCTDCGSTNINRGSAKGAEELGADGKPKNGGKNNNKPKSTTEAIRDLKEKGKRKSLIFKTQE